MHQVKVAEEHVCPLIVILWLDQRIVAHKHSAQFEPLAARQLMLGSRPLGAKLRPLPGWTELSTSWFGLTGPSFAARCGSTDPPVEPEDDVGGSLGRRKHRILAPMGSRPSMTSGETSTTAKRYLDAYGA
jgi:hypothetical protein